MATPSPPQHTLWRLRLRGQYLRPDGTPHRGFVTLTPEPISVTAMTDGTPFTITLQTVRLCIDEDGRVKADLLNPNDPTIEPGPATARRWGYCVRETFERGPVLGWTMDVPTSVGDGEVLDMAKVVRRDEAVYRPADWFPHHLMDTPVQASRISPRVGPLMRCIEEKPVRVPDGPGEGPGDPGWVPPFGQCGCCL